MKDTKTIVVLSKPTEFGHTDEIRFITERHAQGGVEYYLMGYEKWEDGHYTRMPNFRYLKTTKEQGNNLYKRYITEGYKKIAQYTFEPTKMDMR